jgi:hypothetical protein
VLGVSKDAAPADIKRAYHKLALKWCALSTAGSRSWHAAFSSSHTLRMHPDKNPSQQELGVAHDAATLEPCCHVAKHPSSQTSPTLPNRVVSPSMLSIVRNSLMLQLLRRWLPSATRTRCSQTLRKELRKPSSSSSSPPFSSSPFVPLASLAPSYVDTILQV